MAVQHWTGFETGHANADIDAPTPGNHNFGFNAVGTPPSFSTTQKRTGAYGLRLNCASGSACYVQWVWPAVSPGWSNFAIYIVTRPSAGRRIFGTNSTQLGVNLKSTGELEAVALDGAGGQPGGTVLGTSAVLSLNTWYWVSICEVNRDGPLLIIDGTLIASGNPGGDSSTPGGIGCFLTEAAAMEFYIDDWIRTDLSDGPLPPSKCEIAYPASDNARATLWTGGTGGTTNLFDAVNNAPSIGATVETNLTQIEHAGGAAGTTDAYDANLETFASLGVGPDDRIWAFQHFLTCGEDSGTGTKLLNMSMVSNPSMSSGLSNFDVAPVSGATGNYPNNWVSYWSTTTQNTGPLLLSTAPVMRVVRPETATRVASVSQMGLAFCWTPNYRVPSEPKGRHYPNILAH